MQGILAAKRYSSTLEKRSKSESNLKQSDIALSTPKDRNFSSSNNDIIVSGSEVKSPRKYYNTAPARLKPEKVGKISGDLLRPKSCSCAAIPLSSAVPPVFNDIVPPEVMDSFTAAVRSLEQQEQQQSLPPDCRLNCPSSTEHLTLLTHKQEVPEVKVFDDSQVDCSMETEEEDPLPVMGGTVKLDIVSRDSSSSNNNGNSSSSSNNNALKPLLELNILPTLEEVDRSEEHPKSPTSQESQDCGTGNGINGRKSISLKCCRKPFNGHTFSVSPNQVINISSVLDSKFSVRRLVNEFESQSNSQLKSLLSPSSADNTAASNTGRVVVGDDNNKDDVSAQSSSYESDANSSGDDRVSSKKAEGFGCLSFLRRSTHHSFKSDRWQGKDNSNSALIDTPRSFKKGSGDSPCRSRDKLKEKSSYKAKLIGKWPIGHLTTSSTENEKPEFHTMKTGVVKQRLEAFEAKSTIPLPKQQQQQLFIRSHSRSHSATGTSSTYPYDNIDPLSTYGHQRKSSLPQLNNSSSPAAVDYDSNSLPHRFVSLPDRKGSLDSSVFRTFPNANCRSFTVRGFQSNSKSLFTSSRSKSNNVVGYSPPSSGNRQQHGSTHPLTHLPTTYLS